MIRIRALNEESSDESGDEEVQTVTKEAQEQAAFQEYHKALESMTAKKYETAKEILENLLQSNLLVQVKKPESPESFSQPVVALKYCCLKNMAFVLEQLDDLESSLNHYFKAAELDDSDVTLWYRTGMVAVRALDYETACTAFEHGLQCSPRHWPCLEHLIVGLFVLDNYLPCLTYIGRGLEADPHFLTGLALRDYILKDFPGIDTFYSSYCKEFDLLIGQVDYDVEEGKKIVEDALKQKKARQDMIDKSKTPVMLKTIGLLKPLPTKTWLGVGECLVQLHHHIQASSESIDYCCPVDMLLVCSEEDIGKTLNNDEKGSVEHQEEKEKLAPGETVGDSDETKSKKRRRNALNFLEQWMWGGQRRSARVRSSTVRKEVEREECNLGEALRHLVPAVLLPNAIKEEKKETANVKSGEDSSDTMELYRMFQRRESGEEKKGEGRAMSPNSKEELKLLQEEGYFLVAIDACDDSKVFSSAAIPATDKIRERESGDACVNADATGSTENVAGMAKEAELKTEKSLATSDAKCESVKNVSGILSHEMDLNPTGSVDDKEINGLSRTEPNVHNCKEVSDVIQYIEEFNHKNVIQLLERLVNALGRKWSLRWPSKLISTFMGSYVCMRKDVRHYSIFEIEDPEHFSILVSDAWCTLLYLELFVDMWLAESCNANEEFSFADVADAVGQLMMMAGQRNMFGESYLLFVMRVWSLLSHIYLVTGDISAAMQYSEELVEFFTEECQEIKLPNCKFYNLISKDTVSKFLSELTSNQKMCKVQQLHADQQYEELAVVLVNSFQSLQQEQHPAVLGIPPHCSPTVDRPTQMALLLHALWHLARHKECFYWAEACFNEAFQKYLNCEEAEQQKWASTIEKLLAALESCISKCGLSVMDNLESASRVGRLVQNLTHIVCHQMEAPDTAIEMPVETVLPWILLQQVLQRYHEKRLQSDSSEECCPTYIPGYIQVLFTAHEYLGRRSWCCSNEGALLLYTMDVLIPKLKDESLALFRDKLKQGLEQALYCLYGHPNRKNKLKHLQDHGVPQIALNWERALQLYQFCLPDDIPEFDSNNIPSISSDIEPLFKRIISLVPDDCSPVPLVEKMGRYIDGTTPQVPMLGEQSSKLPRQIANIYYLLADFYFKNNEWSKAIRHYLLDVCVNPLRLDSWAGMALARGSLLEVKLNSCEPLRNESEFLRQAATARRCFQRALEIDPRHSVLWIEYGSFVYMVHSFCSRVLKQQAVNLSMEMWTIIEKQKEEMLDLAVKCFTEANKVWLAHGEEYGLQDERWLHHYMLGKVAEKREDNPCSSLNHYIQSCKYLNNNKASFTHKLNYNNPPFLAVEVLEVVYRIHACILKYLEQHEGQVIPKKVRRLFARHLQEVESGPFMAAIKEMDKKSDSEEESRKRSAEGGAIFGLDHLEFSQPLFGSMPMDVQIITDVIEVMETLITKVSSMASGSAKETNIASPSEVKPDAVAASEKNETVSAEDKNNVELEQKPLLGQVDSRAVTFPNERGNTRLFDYTRDYEKKQDTGSKQEESNVVKDTKCVSSVDDFGLKTERDENQDKATEAKVDKNGAKDGSELRSRAKEESDVEKMETDSVGKDNPPGQRSSRDGSPSAGTTSETSSGDNSSSSSSDESSSSDDSSDSSTSSKSDDSSDSGSETPSKLHESAEQKKVADGASKKDGMDKDEDCDTNDSKQSDADKDHYMLINKCLVMLEECVLRFPQHYKSVYRLTHYYFYSKFHRNVQKCRDLLLGSHKCLPFLSRCSGTTVQGLFLDRKNNNFFNGIWRIPSSEIDRPGSFASHMSRCMTLLMEILREQKDQKLLMELAVQLSRIPEADKKYLRDGEREQLSRQALTLCQQSVRAKLLQAGENVASTLLMEVFHCYQRVQKHFTNKESSFASLVLDAYKRHSKVKDATLEQVVRFCQAEFISSRIQAKAKVVSSGEPLPLSSVVGATSVVPSQPQQVQQQQQLQQQLHQQQQHHQLQQPLPQQSQPQQPHQQLKPQQLQSQLQQSQQQTQQSQQQSQQIQQPPQQIQQSPQQSQPQQQKKLSAAATSTTAPTTPTSAPAQVQSAKSRGRPANTNRANKSTVGNWGVGSLPPFPPSLPAMPYPYMFGDSNMLAASMRGGVSPSMEQQLAALNLMNLHAQLGSYQAEFLRHFASTPGSVSPSLLASLATLGAGLGSFPAFNSAVTAPGTSGSSQPKSKDKQNTASSSKSLSSKVSSSTSKTPAVVKALSPVASKAQTPTAPKVVAPLPSKVSTPAVPKVAMPVKVTPPTAPKVSPPAAPKIQTVPTLQKVPPKDSPKSSSGPSLQQKLQATSQAFSEALARSAASSNSPSGKSGHPKYPSPSSTALPGNAGGKHKSKTEANISVPSMSSGVEKNATTSKLINFRKQSAPKTGNGSGKDLKDAGSSNMGPRVHSDFTKVSALLQNFESMSKNTEENITLTHLSSKPKEIGYNAKVSSALTPSYKSGSNISVVDLSPVKSGTNSNVALKNIGHEITVCPSSSSVLKRTVKQSPSQLEIVKKPKISSPLGSLSIPSSITITPKQPDSATGTRDTSANARVKDCVSITEVVRSKNSGGIGRKLLPDSDVASQQEEKKVEDSVEIITLD